MVGRDIILQRLVPELLIKDMPEVLILVIALMMVLVLVVEQGL